MVHGRRVIPVTILAQNVLACQRVLGAARQCRIMSFLDDLPADSESEEAPATQVPAPPDTLVDEDEDSQLPREEHQDPI